MACIRHRGRPFDHGTGWFRRRWDFDDFFTAIATLVVQQQTS